jgi:hypothetical protein
MMVLLHVPVGRAMVRLPRRPGKPQVAQKALRQRSKQPDEPRKGLLPGKKAGETSPRGRRATFAPATVW